jgi:hypothetical protein
MTASKHVNMFNAFDNQIGHTKCEIDQIYSHLDEVFYSFIHYRYKIKLDLIPLPQPPIIKPYFTLKVLKI